MSKKKLIVVALIVALAVLIVPAPLSLEAEAAEEELIKTQVRVAKWDIWLHADGVTWQQTGAPGDSKSLVFDMTEPQFAGYTNLRFEMVAGVTREQFMAAGGWSGYAPDAAGWMGFDDDVLQQIPENYRMNGENQVIFTLAPLDGAKEIKKEWQAEEVEGWRWYLPATVYWYGTPVVEAERVRGFFDVDQFWGLKTGDKQIFYYQHERIGSGADVTIRIYRFKGEIGMLSSRHSKPIGAEMDKETTVSFAAGWDGWRVPLVLTVPDWGDELGFYVTTSETGFRQGVVISAAAATERDYLGRGVDHTNWHAGQDFVGYFAADGRTWAEGSRWALGTRERVAKEIERWRTIDR